MHSILAALLLVFGLSGFQLSTSKKCDFNLEINENWEKTLTEKQFPYDLTEKKSFVHEYDSTQMHKLAILKESIMENIFIFNSVGDRPKKIKLNENIFHSSCAAYQNFKDALEYFKSKQPHYDYNTAPCIYLIQGNKVYVISAQSGQEELMEKFADSFFKSLLKKTAQKRSVFVRDTDTQPVLK